MSEALAGLSNALAAAVTAAGPYTVRIEGRRRIPATGIVWAADGVILTAHHVIERSESVTVGLEGERSLPATLIGRDPTTDLAALRVQEGNLPVPALVGAGDVQVGHLVLAAGRPGRTVMATLGIISALGGQWRTPAGGEVDRYLQTDIVMYPGFSGGPLVDSAGKVVGMNTSGLLRNTSLTIPVPTLRRVMEALLTHGRVQRAYLGVGAQPVQLPAGLAQQLGQETGLLIISVEPDSPASKGGLLLGDTIVALAGEPVLHLDDLLAKLSSERVNVATPVKIIRGGQVQELSVVTGERE